MYGEPMELGLRGRRALITGASSGLGLGCARALAAEGVTVVLASRSQERLDAAAATVRPAQGAAVLTLVSDVSDTQQALDLVDRTNELIGGIDILIANAGGPPAGDFASTDLDQYLPALQLNLLSTVALCKATVPAMCQRGWGRVVAITSVSVRQPIPHLILSNTARSGLTGFLKTLAREVASQGVTVNSLQPGLHATDRLVQLYDDIDAVAAGIPAKTLGDPDDFGRIAAFLCSDSARFIIGSAIPVDGAANAGLQ
jgi:3-oxoacyl-[acyl-carrier protein] reductase